MITIATWNVNSVRSRLCHITSWLEVNEVDILCLQETKVQDKDFSRLIGKKGKGLLIHNPSILHRASYVKSGFRDLIIIWFKIKKLK